MKYLLVEGITDVQLIKYICIKNNITIDYDDFKKQKGTNSNIGIYKFNDLHIIDINGQENLDNVLSNILLPIQTKIEFIGIIQDADDGYHKSADKIKDAIRKSTIEVSKFKYFLTPNNKDDKGDLETLLLSTINDNCIVKCFSEYKKCLLINNEVHPKALNKGQVYAYTMYSQSGKDLHKPQDSFMYKFENQYIDTELWDLSKAEFQPIITFVTNIFKD